jgi:hypothetical protein
MYLKHDYTLLCLTELQLFTYLFTSLTWKIKIWFLLRVDEDSLASEIALVPKDILDEKQENISRIS